MNNIGLFGGTFDPIHNGHLTIAECFVTRCRLDVCYIIPAKSSPFKADKPKMLSDDERCTLIEAKIAGTQKLVLSKYELENSEISYTIDTMTHFHSKFPEANLYLLIGTDQALKFHLWRDYEKILQMSRIVIATRPEAYSADDLAQIQVTFQNTNYIQLNNPIINITSTMLREGQSK
ncbi:MAG: nicotinate (nicotinamide) nucleotide adenylyltransferase [Ignavibacteria bacterium]|jgi:nicotinate-nucleotide adenylyltransferase|nr:nicotinate (nicotinamide) nucleotide adenylyltransferase [Ignavibacteria bacterium]